MRVGLRLLPTIGHFFAKANGFGKVD